jgi:hypothetical protein
MDTMGHMGDLVSASSFGSCASSEPIRSRCSDLDWIVVFASVHALTSSECFGQMLRALAQLRLGFSNPVLSLESVEERSHMIGPIFHGVCQSPCRHIVGEDPVQLFQRHGIEKNDPIIVDRMFSSFTRYFFEDLPLLSGRLDDTGRAALLQKATNYFLDTYRSMIVLACPSGDVSAPLSYDAYLDRYGAALAPSVQEDGRAVLSFIAAYQGLVQLLDDDDRQATRVAADAEALLRRSMGVAVASARFIHVNIRLFRSQVQSATPNPAHHADPIH